MRARWMGSLWSAAVTAETPRDFVQIAREAGLLTFHVETEEELDRAALGRMDVVGVTAGASTPNWMIQNVVREIEAIRGASDRSLTRWAASALKFMVMSHFFGALAAFCLSYAALTLMGLAPPMVYPLITALYVYAMHAFNRVLDKGASTYNDPERARFHGRYGTFLVCLGGAAIFACLFLAYAKSVHTFFLLAALSLLGVLYSIPLVPRKIHARYPTQGSKISRAPRRSRRSWPGWPSSLCPLCSKARETFRSRLRPSPSWWSS